MEAWHLEVVTRTRGQTGAVTSTILGYLTWPAAVAYMEFKHACKLCDRKFANGKSMGGHMRSHFVKLQIQRNTSSPHPSESLYAPNPSELPSVPKTITTPGAACVSGFLNLDYGYAHGSRSHFASSGTRFSAEMELGVRTSARKRSKRTHPQLKGMESAQLNAPLLNSMHGHFSSPDELVTVEDVALCLIMLSKDKWPEGVPHPKVTILSDSDDVPRDDDAFNFDENNADPDVDDDDEDFSDSMDLKVFGRRCGICKKVFKSYQALGGHMRNHKRPVTVPTLAVEKKEFPCKICLKVFPSGQALGGHKKVHFITEKKPVGNPLPLPIVEVDSASASDSGSSFASMSTSGNDEARSSDTDNYYNGSC